MKGGRISDFIDKLGYVELATEYKGRKLFYYGIDYHAETQAYSFIVEEETLDVPFGTYIRTVFETSSPLRSKCLDKFLEAKLLDGKTFWELEQDMTWIET